MCLFVVNGLLIFFGVTILWPQRNGPKGPSVAAVSAAFSSPTGSGKPSMITEDVGAKRRDLESRHKKVGTEKYNLKNTELN